MQFPDLSPYQSLLSRIFINAPFDRLEKDLLPLFLQHRLQPEIGLEGNCLWLSTEKSFHTLAQTLLSHNLGCTLHAPFHDLTPGGFDRELNKITREKLQRAFHLIPVFRPQSIVCHLGYNHLKHSQDLERWLDVSEETWRPLLQMALAHNTPVMFENTYEAGPEIHLELFTRLGDYHPSFCLDTGHVLAFSSCDWHQWFAPLKHYLGQVHLHDNDGTGDHHLAIGRGCFAFPALFDAIETLSHKPLVTLEQRTAEDVATSLDYLQHCGIF